MRGQLEFLSKGKKTMQEIPRGSTGTFSRRRTILITTLVAAGAGMTASVLAVVTMGILRLWAGIPTPVELFGDFVLKHIDVHTFVHLLVTYGPNAKTTPLGMALLAMIGLGVILSGFYAAIVHVTLPTAGLSPTRRDWFTMLGFLLGLTLISILLLCNELRQNFLGLPVDLGRAPSSFGRRWV